MPYINKQEKVDGCVFCIVQAEADSAANLIVFRGKNSYVILNRYPYTSGHLMVIPFKHGSNLEDLAAETRSEMMELTSRCTTVLRKIYKTESFNVGINIGQAAGAGVADHVHIHIVPRWAGDTNFMTTLGETRVLPESLEDTYHRLHKGFL